MTEPAPSPREWDIVDGPVWDALDRVGFAFHGTHGPDTSWMLCDNHFCRLAHDALEARGDAPTPEPRGLREALDAIEDMANDRDYDTVTAMAAAGILRAALAADTRPAALDVHVNDGSAHDDAMAWSKGHTDGYEEAVQALRDMLTAIPATGLLRGANRYDTDDKHVLHVWRDGVSWEIEVSRATPETAIPAHAQTEAEAALAEHRATETAGKCRCPFCRRMAQS